MLSMSVQDLGRGGGGVKNIKRSGGWKRIKFNPNYYPERSTGHKFDKSQREQWQCNPKVANNHNNVAKFFKETKHKRVLRIHDQVEGERYYQSNHWQARLTTHIARRKDNNEFAEDSGPMPHPAIHPLPVTHHFSPTSCPIIKLMDDLWSNTDKWEKNRSKRGFMRETMKEIRQMQLRKVRKIEEKYAATVETIESWEKDLLLVTHANEWEIKEKLAEILESEQEHGDHIDPGDIYLRIGSLSPFGKEKTEIVENFEETYKKYEKFLQAKDNIELDPYRVILTGLDNIKPTIDFDYIRRGNYSTVIVVPKPIQDMNAIKIATRWLIEAVWTPDVTKPYAITKGPNAQYQMGRDRQAPRLRMAEEILKAYDSSGYAMSKKLSHHKIAEAQRQYANLYWSGKLVK